MKKICKKLLIILAVLAMAVSALTFSGCSYYSAQGLEGDYQSGEVSSQGGWVVQKGNYIYFINGMTTAETDEEGNEKAYENEYGDAVRGALMRIAVSDLDAGNYDAAETVVPLLFVADDYTAGIFIYGDYVYYATPTTAKNLQGEAESNYVDFKRSRLDGKETMRDYYFRSDDAAAEYRFVEIDGTVYCLHMDGSDLWSYNTATREDTMLAKNTASHLFNRADAQDPYVYYTMNVTEDIDQTNSAQEDYTQVYRVRADASYTLDEKNATYTVTDPTDTYEYTYDFDLDSMKSMAEDASEDDAMADFDAKDLSTYPYVNLGQLLLDGRGSADEKSQYNQSQSEPYSPDGFTYTLLSYDNGGIYYRRTSVGGTSSTGESGWTFYLAAENFTADWDSVSGNADTNPATPGFGGYNDVISLTTTEVGSSTLFYIEEGTHYYLYNTGTSIIRVKINDETGAKAEEITIAKNVSVGSFLYLDNTSSDTYKYVWYTLSSDSGQGIGRAVYDSNEAGYAGNEEEYYNALIGKEEYKPTGVLGATTPSEWYVPEIIGNYVFSLDTTVVGSLTLNLPQVTSLANAEGDMMNNAELQAYNDLLAEAEDALADASAFDTKAGNLLYYYFHTGDGEMMQTIIDEYIEEDEEVYGTYSVFSKDVQDYFNAYVNRSEYTNKNSNLSVDFSELLALKDENGTPIEDEDGNYTYYDTRSYFYHTIGILSEDEEEELMDAWRANYLSALVETDEGLPAWAWALIGIAIGVGVIGVACAIVVPVVLHRRKKNAENGTSSSRKKYKVDMTYDESIDVYAPEEEDAHSAEADPADIEAMTQADAEASVEEAEEAAEETEGSAETSAEEASEANDAAQEKKED